MNITLIASALALQLFPGLVPNIPHTNPSQCMQINDDIQMYDLVQALNPPERLVGSVDYNGEVLGLSVSDDGLHYTIFSEKDMPGDKRLVCIWEMEQKQPEGNDANL